MKSGLYQVWIKHQELVEGSRDALKNIQSVKVWS